MALTHPKKHAAVAVILFEDEQGRPSVVMNMRSKPYRKAGSYCFPGGSMDPGESPDQAARREAMEENGADQPGLFQGMEALGLELPAVPSGTGHWMYPVVYRMSLDEVRSLEPSPDEVSEIFFLPLEAVRSTNPEFLRVDRGRILLFPAQKLREYVTLPSIFAAERDEKLVATKLKHFGRKLHHEPGIYTYVDMEDYVAGPTAEILKNLTDALTDLGGGLLTGTGDLQAGFRALCQRENASYPYRHIADPPAFPEQLGLFAFRPEVLAGDLRKRRDELPDGELAKLSFANATAGHPAQAQHSANLLLVHVFFSLAIEYGFSRAALEMRRIDANRLWQEDSPVVRALGELSSHHQASAAALLSTQVLDHGNLYQVLLNAREETLAASGAHHRVSPHTVGFPTPPHHAEPQILSALGAIAMAQVLMTDVPNIKNPALRGLAQKGELKNLTGLQQAVPAHASAEDWGRLCAHAEQAGDLLSKRMNLAKALDGDASRGYGGLFHAEDLDMVGLSKHGGDWFQPYALHRIGSRVPISLRDCAGPLDGFLKRSYER